MINELIYTEVQCPYCWQTIEVVVDNCGEDQQYIEDCQVCCRPINFSVVVDEYQRVKINVCTDQE